MENDNTQSSNRFTECLHILAKSNLQCDKKTLVQLIDEYGDDLFTIKLLANYLSYFHAGQLAGLATIPILHNKNGQQQPLQRLLSAFKHQLHGSAELTLLYMLSLSKSPVYQQHMMNTLHCSPVKRLLQRKSAYKTFLHPLSKLNRKNWQALVKKLQELKLINLSVTNSGTLLSLAEPTRDFFQQNWQTQKCPIVGSARNDMDTIATQTNAILKQNRPANSPPCSPAGVSRNPARRAISPPSTIWNKEQDMQLALKQLSALRSSLNAIDRQAREVKRLLQPQPTKVNPKEYTYAQKQTAKRAA